MLGMEMMLKSLGLDPEEIRKSVNDVGVVIIKISQQLDRIEQKLDALGNDRANEPASEIPVAIPATLQIVGE